MDKRTKIAILVVAVIMGVNLVITSRMQKQRLREQQAAREAMPEMLVPPPPAAPGIASGDSAAGPAAAAPPVGAMPFQAATGGEGDIVVETPLQRVRISLAGAVIEGVELREFEMASGGPVDLVPQQFAAQPGQYGLGLTVRAPGVTWDLSRARFEPQPAVPGTITLAAGAAPYTLALRSAAAGGGAIVKRFTFQPDRYDFQVDLQLEPGAGLQGIDSYTLEWSTGLPVTEGNVNDDLHSFKTGARVGEDVKHEAMRGFKRPEPKAVVGAVQWTTLQSKYFMVALVPTPAQNGTAELLGLAERNWMGMRFTNPTPWRTGVDTYRVYAGPIAYEQLQELGAGLESTVELGWTWIRPLSWVLLRLMHALHHVIANYGIVIIILSALTKLVFWPLTEKSFKSMRSMQELQPRMEELKRRFKDDPQEMNRQVMALYRERKINPLGGCMPLIIQTPIFFALYSVLRSSIELRNAPFVAWIDNLAAPDVLVHLPKTFPVISNHVSLLPLVMGGAMLLQSKMGATGMPATGPAAQQQFVMKWIMPIMMTFFFYQMPSGLVLYWTVNTLMSIVQQAQINRKLGPATAAARAVTPEIQGRSANGAPDRVDGAERGRSSATRPGRVGGKAR
jgi:YidC/Oxa1 family membrane protein insertase